MNKFLRRATHVRRPHFFYRMPFWGADEGGDAVSTTEQPNPRVSPIHVAIGLFVVGLGLVVAVMLMEFVAWLTVMGGEERVRPAPQESADVDQV
jgi:hypothetical protein